jgi:hypothetical protein
LEDEEIGVFASQILTSQSWYRGRDPRAADAAFAQMVKDAVDGTTDRAVQDALRNAAEKIDQTL